MLTGVSLAAWQVVHRWLGRVFFVAWVIAGVHLARNDWEPDGWHVVFLVVNGANLVVGGLKDAAQRRVVEERLERIEGSASANEPEAEASL